MKIVWREDTYVCDRIIGPFEYRSEKVFIEDGMRAMQDRCSE